MKNIFNLIKLEALSFLLRDYLKTSIKGCMGVRYVGAFDVLFIETPLKKGFYKINGKVSFLVGYFLY